MKNVRKKKNEIINENNKDMYTEAGTDAYIDKARKRKRMLMWMDTDTVTDTYMVTKMDTHSHRTWA